ncbi:Metallo-dependent hydrolase [Trametes versicolor FP-101664 SS1]|uniref:adenosine deaminase n=1 Tax=Trametes versicolor (strain FP-101664) TaxID=717944 RepID=R7S749_TRAVS|nr:Metallo-dependent hydrolase [Trametes versicolor FP-101664 SS1]EIW51838.1 Metallo-dependent hydrolase [Trametes versicolor FP-101664 SS1]
MDDYHAQRKQLIADDRALRIDHAAQKEISEEERRADKMLRHIRSSEAVSVWSATQPLKHLHGSQQLFPGMAFLTARETIVGTKLFDILSKMPKGGLLHAHHAAMVRVDVLLKLALSQPAIHIRVPAVLCSATIGTALPEFRGLSRAEWTTHPSITDQRYAPDTWVPIQNARSNFSHALGGPEGFDRWFTNIMTINPSEAYGTHNTTGEIWKKFQSTFIAAQGLIFFEPISTEYIREFFYSSIEDGISYVEVRMAFHQKYMTGADGERNVPHRVWLQLYDHILKEVKADMKQQGREDEFVGSKIIYSILRIITPEEIEWYLEDCIAMKQEFPHLISGFDLIGHEDTLLPLIYYAESLLRFVERQKELGIEIPFMFHAGETLGDGTVADMNLYDAILLGTKRIGHGFSLIKHPKLMQICRERDICVEVCPISNEILRLTGSMPMHPLPAVMNQGVHVALCSDDPAVFGNMGLTFDFYQVFVASEVNNLTTLHELVWDSIRYSALSHEEKECAFEKLERRWNIFVRYILDTYGGAA